MKRNLYMLISLIMVLSLLAQTESAASLALITPTPELGQLKVCKVAGAGVTEGRIFTIKVGNRNYNVPAGPGEGGFCVLAGQYPLDTEVTIQEQIPAGYYVARIEAKPARLTSKDVEQGTAVVKIGSGVTEVIFTNRVIGLPTPTQEPPGPTRTPTSTPECDPNCTPTPTPIPRGRLQICKEADGAGVNGDFTFSFAGRSVTIPAGACSGLIGVNAGTLTITEQARPGFVVTDIYTIPSDRLINEQHNSRSTTVTIVEGFAATQTIVVFRNRASAPTATPTPTWTNTPITHTPTITATGSGTPTNTPTGTLTPPVCQPVTVDFGQIPLGGSVEGLGRVHPDLNIDARATAGDALHILEGSPPAAYGSIVNGLNIPNAGMVMSGGFSDFSAASARLPHQYSFTFRPGMTIRNFTLHMLDFGDFNPTGSPAHVITMTAYNASNAVVMSQELSFTTVGTISPVYGDLLISGNAASASPGQPGNWTWNVSGEGIVRVELVAGVGYDPAFGLHTLTFNPCEATPSTPTPTPTTPSSCRPVTVDFGQIPLGGSVEGLGTVHPDLNIDARGAAGDALHIVEGTQPASYGSIVNGSPLPNAGMVSGGGFSDFSAATNRLPHEYTFTFGPGITISNFTLQMLDFGDFNPTGSSSHVITMTAFNASNAVVTSQQLSFTTVGTISPVYGDLLISGNAASASPGQPGNWTWNVSGNGITRVVLQSGTGYDPAFGLRVLTFTPCP